MPIHNGRSQLDRSELLRSVLAFFPLQVLQFMCRDEVGACVIENWSETLGVVVLSSQRV